MSDFSVFLRTLTGQESGLWVYGDCCDLVNWAVNPPDWSQLPQVVSRCRVDDVREELPVTVIVHRDACPEDQVEIAGGTIGEDGRADILTLYGIHYVDHKVCIDDVEPTSGTVYLFGSGEKLIAPEGWN